MKGLYTIGHSRHTMEYFISLLKKAIIVPPSRKNKTLLGIVLVSFAASFAFAYLPVINQIDEGTRTIILTIVISAAAALLFPVKEEEENENVA